MYNRRNSGNRGRLWGAALIIVLVMGALGLVALAYDLGVQDDQLSNQLAVAKSTPVPAGTGSGQGVWQPQTGITSTAVLTGSNRPGSVGTSLLMVQVGDVFLPPVAATDVFNDESSWLIAEPGVLLDATAVFDRGSSRAEHFVQCPEGGFLYASLGGGKMTWGETSTWEVASKAGTNNIVMVRCRIDDGLQDTDLNVTLTFSEYVPGNIITSPMPQGAYISKGWVSQQLEMSFGLNGQSGGNCGASGCSTANIHMIDIDSNLYQNYSVQKDDVDSWKLVYSNDR